MLVSNFEKVRDFHRLTELPVLTEPTFPSEDRISLRKSLIDEERRELEEALAERDLVKVADALTDLLYVIYGAGLEFGLPMDDCFTEIHNSNMSKLGEDGRPIRREDGKILKGPNYRPPNLKSVVFKDGP